MDISQPGTVVVSLPIPTEVPTPSIREAIAERASAPADDRMLVDTRSGSSLDDEEDENEDKDEEIDIVE